MAQSCLLYYITDRTQFPGDDHDRRRALLAKIVEAACVNVDYIQLREKDLVARELENLARECVEIIQRLRTENRELRTRLLINSRTDVALAVGADGVHLRSGDVSPSTARSIWREAIAGDSRLETRSSISPSLAIQTLTFSAPRLKAPTSPSSRPSSRKKTCPARNPQGLSALRAACEAKIPVLALGGVTFEKCGVLPRRRSRWHRRNSPLPGE